VALVALAQRIEGCRACPEAGHVAGGGGRDQAAPRSPASSTGGRPVPGFGDPGARLVVVGLAPAAHGANRTGRVFTGDRSGDLALRRPVPGGLRGTSRTAGSRDDGLELRDAYVTAAVRCAAAGQQADRRRARHVACRSSPRSSGLLGDAAVIVVLGQFAFGVVAALEGLRPRPRFAPPRRAPLADGRVLLCSYHPSQQNTFTGTLTEAMFDAVFARSGP